MSVLPRTRHDEGMMSKVIVMMMLAVSLLGAKSSPGQVTEMNPQELQNIGIDEHLGDFLPLEDLSFVRDAGDTGSFKQIISGGKPVILTMYYSDCPMLCSLVLTGLQKAIQDVEFAAGVDYKLVTVSIDPLQSLEKSKAGRDRFGGGLPIGSNPEGWRFFTGDSGNIGKLTRAVGFRYFYVEERKEYAHPAVLVVLTSEGKISRYLYGIEFKPSDVRMALLEASEGKIGNTIDKILLYCYHYDPSSKGYVVMAGQVMKIGGGITVLVLGVLLGLLWMKDAQKYAGDGDEADTKD